MGTNADVAATLREIGDLLDLNGERFKPDAYRRASRSIETLTEDVRKVAGRGELESIPGVGAAIGEKIREFLRDGHIAYLEKLRQQFPPGIVELMRLPGIGPKTARRFLVELQVEGPAELAAAIDAGRLKGLAGFGDRKIALFRQAVEARGPVGRRQSLRAAWSIATSLVERLRAEAPVERVEVAGSLRRRRESVGDLDILVTSNVPERVFEVFSALPMVREVKLRGPTKETVVLSDDLQVDLRVVEPAAFGAAWQYFTGSKDHNVRLRSLARDMGLRLNEYGVTREETRVAGASEEDVYRSLGLPWFPPEIRENQGEFEAAARDLPPLLEESHLRGDLHVHLPEGSSRDGIDRLRSYATQRGWEYVGVVVSDRPDAKELLDQLRAGQRPGTMTPWLLAAWEDPLGSDRLPPAGCDYRIHSAVGPDPPDPLPTHGPLLLTHLPLAEAGAEASAERVARWVEYARRAGAGLEVTPDGPQDGLDSSGVRRAIEARVPVSVRGAGPVVPDPLTLAVGLARRGWATAPAILNARAMAELTGVGRGPGPRTTPPRSSVRRTGPPRTGGSPR
jgi:DNA polymerase/3'-5' exonuclease PolX